MTQIATYFDLIFSIQVSDHKISLLKMDSKHQNDLDDEILANSDLNTKLEELRKSLETSNNAADEIRSGYSHIIKGVLKSFSRIEKWPGYYPDLSQGMIIPGYLFLMILSDLKTNLTTEGSYRPIPHIYMSEQEWPVTDLKNILIQLDEELSNIQFNNKVDAINFYEKRVRSCFERQMHILKELRLI